MKSYLLVFSLLILFVCALQADEKSVKKHKVIPATHNGVILELNEETGYLEYVHNAEKGELMIYVLDKDGKPQKISDLPKVILFITEGAMAKKNLTAAFLEKDIKEADNFIVKDDSLKTKTLNGRIAINVGKSSFQVNFIYDTPQEKRKREKEVKEEEEALKKKEAEKK